MSSILQWNIRGYRANYGDLTFLLRELEPKCICLQETMLGAATPRPPSGYAIRTFSPNNQAIPGDGLAILIHESHSITDLNLNTPLQAMALRTGLNRQITICNIYISPNEQIQQHHITDLISQLPPPFLMLGDFNAKHTIWGDDVSDPRGRIIEQVLLDHDVSIMNTGEPTHHHIHSNSLNALDLSLCSPCLLPLFRWQVLDDPHGSDHFPVTITEIEPEAVQRLPRLLLRKANWANFRKDTEMQPLENEQLEDKISKIYDVLRNATNRNIPKSNGTQKRRVPWWNEECSRVNWERKRALRRYQRTNSLVDKITYNRWTAIARATKREARLTSWQNYVSTINSDTPMTKIWSRVQKMTGRYKRQNAPCLSSANGPTACPNQVAEILAGHFATVSSSNNYTPNFMRIKTQAEAENLNFSGGDQLNYNSPITMKELKGALKETRNTSPGADEIRYEMLKHLHPSALENLLRVFNHVWENKTYPSSWRSAVVLAFPKPGKPQMEASSYRPIALTSCVGKLLEKIVNIRLMNYLESNSLLSPYQSGFRRNRSAPDALIRLSSDILETFRRKEHMVCVFFDLTKAYDTTWRFGIIKKIHEVGIRGRMANFIMNFLNDRNFCTKVGQSISTVHQQEEGVPQGSVLSCALFALAVDNITRDLPRDVKCSLYVDDFMIYSSSKYLPTLERRLQLAVNTVMRWTTEHGFTISEPKTVAVHFNRLRGYAEPDLRLGNRMIVFRSEAKFLGMIFDQKLTWKSHIKELKTSCMSRLKLLRSLSHTDWGSDRATIMRLYRALVRSKLDYGSIIYASASDSVIRSLDPIQNAAMRIASGAFKSSPVASLCAELAEPPLYIRRMKLTLQYYSRIQLIPQSPTNLCVHRTPLSDATCGTFASRVHEAMAILDIADLKALPVETSDAPIWNIPMGTVCPGFKPPRKADCNPIALRALFLHHLHEKHENTTHIYTDGSKINDSVGCAAVGEHNEISQRLRGESSIFTAELTAINDALSIINNSNDRNFTIFTDSQSAIQSIDHYNNNHPIVLEIVTKLLRLLRRNKAVCICWAPGHTNIDGNERADTEARRAATSDAAIENTALPHRDYYAQIKVKTNAKWQELWAETPLSNKLRALKDSTREWGSSHHRTRRVEITMARLRLGHTRMTHGFLMERGEPPICDTCQTQISVQHILTECTKYSAQRRRYFPDIAGLSPADAMKKILTEYPGIHFDTNRIIEFLMRSNLYKNM